MNWLNYHHLKYFWAVAREGSVIRASELMHVSPATISIQLRELEKSVGVKLFRKSGRGLTLTETGMLVQTYAQDIFALGQELLDSVNGRPTGGQTTLRVGVKDVMPKLVSYQLLEPTLRNPESVRLSCYEGDITNLIADLAIHKLDVVLSDTPVDPAMRVKAYSHLLGESEVIMMGTKPLAKKLRDRFPESINGAPLLLPMKNSVLRSSLEHWFEAINVRPRIIGEFDDSAMMKIMGSKGIGIFPAASVIQKEVEAMYQVELIGRVPNVSEKFYALSSERKVKHAAVLAITEVARTKFAGRTRTNPPAGN